MSKWFDSKSTPRGQCNPVYSEVGGCLNNGYVIDLTPSKFDRSDLQNVLLEDKRSSANVTKGSMNGGRDSWGMSNVIKNVENDLDLNGNRRVPSTGNGNQCNNPLCASKPGPLIDTRL
jgi:hypothetical protein